jgi:hypothetical protein
MESKRSFTIQPTSAGVIIVTRVIDETSDLGFEIIRQVMVLEQNAVLKRLVPALDHSSWVIPRLRMN